jgi:hypothetical protein
MLIHQFCLTSCHSAARLNSFACVERIRGCTKGWQRCAGTWTPDACGRSRGFWGLFGALKKAYGSNLASAETTLTQGNVVDASPCVPAAGARFVGRGLCQARVRFCLAPPAGSLVY